jgi:hypothetical protein
MKKAKLVAVAILLAGALFLSGFKLAQVAKEYTLKFNETQIQMLWSSLEFSKSNLKTSQASASDVTNVTNVIDSVQHLILIQYSKQVDTTTNNKK